MGSIAEKHRGAKSAKIVVAGSGIIGLYTCWNLIQEAGVKASNIEVIAEFLPGDSSINFTSPWAGGNFSCISPNDPETLSFDKFTYTKISALQKALGGPQCGLDMKPSTEFWDDLPETAKIESLKSYLKDFRVLEKKDLPPNVAFGISFTTWNFNCPVFLANFKKYLQNEGVSFRRQKLTHISQAYSAHTIAVFNCTGIGAFSLSGVKDSNVYPTRGQVLVAHAPHIQENRMRWGSDYATYIIPRPHSNGQLILGGFLQKDNWTADTFEKETKDIIERTTKLLPKILDHPIKIIAVAAGLRPSRYGGARIELQMVEGKMLIHNYGAGGYGYQSGLGMSSKAVELFRSNSRLQSKL